MTLELNGRVIEYDFQRKKIKNINLRIRSDGSISVSAPHRAPMGSVEDFLRANGSYILRALDKFKAREARSLPELEYKDGDKITVLGYTVPLRVAEGNKNYAEMTSDGVFLLVKDVDDVELKRKTVATFLEDVCRRAVNELCEKIYPVFEEKKVVYPTVKFRRMRTKWGICRPERKELTFSYMLAAAPIECIEYVVYHEFNHFLHPDHSKAFYESLEKLLPDWKERKKRLGNFEMIKQ